MSGNNNNIRTTTTTTTTMMMDSSNHSNNDSGGGGIMVDDGIPSCITTTTNISSNTTNTTTTMDHADDSHHSNNSGTSDIVMGIVQRRSISAVDAMLAEACAETERYDEELAAHNTGNPTDEQQAKKKKDTDVTKESSSKSNLMMKKQQEDEKATHKMIGSYSAMIDRLGADVAAAKLDEKNLKKKKTKTSGTSILPYLDDHAATTKEQTKSNSTAVNTSSQPPKGGGGTITAPGGPQEDESVDHHQHTTTTITTSSETGPTVLERGTGTGIRRENSSSGIGAYSVTGPGSAEFTLLSSDHDDSDNGEEREQGQGGLAEAIPVDSHRIVDEAQPVDEHHMRLDQQAQVAYKKAKDKKCKRLVYGFVILGCIVLVLSLTFGLRKKNGNNGSGEENATPGSLTSTSSDFLPPMENLEVLYNDLPTTTKESLSDITSPQYQSWDWLLHHPDVLNLQEWRKKQIFALGTFFYAFEGPNWPEHIRDRWMDVHSSECSWVMTHDEVDYITQMSSETFGNGYDRSDYQPCNFLGELQTILLFQLYLPQSVLSSSTKKAMMPPEIGLLSSLRTLGIMFSQISNDAKISNMLIPEVIQLPNLVQLILQNSGMSGPIPKQVGHMSSLRHLAIGANKLTGTIPSQVGTMVSLEYFGLSYLQETTGNIPSEVGLMTKLTAFDVFSSALTGTIPTQSGLLTGCTFFDTSGNQLSGQIPTELGLLTSMTFLNLWRNHLGGQMPSELGLMTNLEWFKFRNNAFTGLIPSELGLMTGLKVLNIGNNLNEEEGGLNDFSGPLPKELWELSHLEELYLPNLPDLSGRVPTDILMPNLTMFKLFGSPFLSGTIPEQICVIEDLDFDCSDLLCGCGCQCATSSVNDTNN